MFAVWANNISCHTVTSVGQRDLRETQKEESLVLARALQCCMERSEVPPRVLYSMVRDLQRCMEAPHVPQR